MSVELLQKCLLNGVLIHVAVKETYGTNNRTTYLLKCKRKTCTGSAMYLIGGKYVSEDELVENYVLTNGEKITRS